MGVYAFGGYVLVQPDDQPGRGEIISVGKDTEINGVGRVAHFEPEAAVLVMVDEDEYLAVHEEDIVAISDQFPQLHEENE